MLSPGVFLEETDSSAIAPTVSNSIGVFSGDFTQGPIDQYLLITTVDELISYYGYPTNVNYGNWYQAYNFLQYGNKLYINRVLKGTEEAPGDKNGVAEALDTSYAGLPLLEEDYEDEYIEILNDSDFEQKESSIAFTGGAKSVLKFISRNPGAWADNLSVAIAKPAAFGTTTASMAFSGIPLDNLFDYIPTGTELGVIVKYKDEIVEIFTVNLSSTAKDSYNKSTYIEDVINKNSNYIFVKHNTANTGTIENYLYTDGSDATSPKPLVFFVQADGVITEANLLDGYSIWENKEEVDIDIVIGNEIDGGVSAKNLVETRQDCIAFIGANYGDTVGKKSSVAVSNLVAWRKTGDLNYNSMFVCACANYKLQYDRYNDKDRWINIAGDIAGLRAATSTNRASWWASAGLERGRIKNIKKLAFNPTQAQRDFFFFKANYINKI